MKTLLQPKTALPKRYANETLRTAARRIQMTRATRQVDAVAIQSPNTSKGDAFWHTHGLTTAHAERLLRKREIAPIGAPLVPDMRNNLLRLRVETALLAATLITLVVTFATLMLK